MGKHIRTLLLILLALSVLLAACGKPAEPEETTAAPVETTTAAPAETTTTTPTETESEETQAPPVQGEPEMIWQNSHENGLNSVAVSPDGLYVAVGEYLTTYIYRAADGMLADVHTYYHSVEDLEYFPGGVWLANGLTLGGVVLTNLEDGTELQLHGGYNNRLAISPDGSVVATGNRDGMVWLWDASSGSEKAALAGPPDETKWVSALAYHPSGNLLASAQWVDDGIIHIWDLTSESIQQTLKLKSLFGSIANPMAFSPDGELVVGIAYIDWVDHIVVWDVGSGEELNAFEVPKNARDVAFSSKDDMLAVVSPDEVTIWDVRSGTMLYQLAQTFDETLSDWNVAVSFTPDGGHVALVRFDGTAELWRLPGADPIPAPPIDIRTPPPLPGDVLFDTGSSELKDAASPALEDLANELYENFKDATIKFIGHTDSRGSDADNQKLSLDRAAAIQTWFEDWANQNGADGWTFEIDGLGSGALKVPDVDTEGTFLEEAGALNRRVEIEIDAP